MTSDIKLSNPSAEPHDDWEVTSIGGLSAHLNLGGAAQLFEFRPVNGHGVFQFVFLGIGLGWSHGYRFGNADIPDTTKATSVRTRLKCLTSFSAIDLNRSAGRLTTASATASFGYGVTIITAFGLKRTFFDSQELYGVTAGGFGYGASVNAGLWLQIP